MPRQDASCRIKSKDFFANAFEEKRSIATREIPTPHALAEKDISRDEQTPVSKVKAKAARAMAWHMEAEDFETGDGFRLALLEKQIRLAGFVLNVESVLFEKSPVCEHGDGFRMKRNSATVTALDFCRIHYMVEMPMGQKQPIDRLTCKKFVGPLGSIE